MKYGKLIFTKKDYQLINLVLLNWRKSEEMSNQNFDKLSNELLDVQFYDENQLPMDVVKFGSVVDIQTPLGLLNDFELVVPSEKNIKQKKLSVLSPIGSAIIGYAEGDEISWNFPVGEKTIKILNVNNRVLT